MALQKEPILHTGKISAVRYLWYLLILGGAAVVGLYLLYSMSTYQSEKFPYTTAELFERSLSSDGGLPFVALIIPATALIAYFIVRSYSKMQVIVTDQRVYGILTNGCSFNILLSRIKKAEKISRTSLEITTASGVVLVRCLGNCNEIYTALMGKPPKEKSRAAYRKQARLSKWQKLNTDVLTTRAGISQAAIRIALAVTLLLSAGCLVLAIINFAEYGLASALPFLALPAVFVLIIAIPLFYTIGQTKVIAEVIDTRVKQSKEKNGGKSFELMNWKDTLTAKCRRATKVLLCIIIICPLILCTALFGDFDFSHTEDMVSCSSCDREFKRSSDNGRSISSRGLCELCYENMKTMQDALDNWDK